MEIKELVKGIGLYYAEGAAPYAKFESNVASFDILNGTIPDSSDQFSISLKKEGYIVNNQNGTAPLFYNVNEEKMMPSSIDISWGNPLCHKGHIADLSLQYGNFSLSIKDQQVSWDKETMYFKQPLVFSGNVTVDPGKCKKFVGGSANYLSKDDDDNHVLFAANVNLTAVDEKGQAYTDNETALLLLMHNCYTDVNKAMDLYRSSPALEVVDAAAANVSTVLELSVFGDASMAYWSNPLVNFVDVDCPLL